LPLVDRPASVILIQRSQLNKGVSFNHYPNGLETLGHRYNHFLPLLMAGPMTGLPPIPPLVVMLDDPCTASSNPTPSKELSHFFWLDQAALLTGIRFLHAVPSPIWLPDGNPSIFSLYMNTISLLSTVYPNLENREPNVSPPEPLGSL